MTNITNPTYKNLETQTISSVLNFIPVDSRLDYIKNYDENGIKQYNELMCEILDDIINVYDKTLYVSMLGYVDNYNDYVDASKSKIGKKTIIDLVKAHPILNRLFILSQKYKLFDILFDCTYFTPCKKTTDSNIKLSASDIYKTDIEEDRPDIDMFNNNKDKLMDESFVDETHLDYGHGTYPSLKHTGFIFHFNIRLTNFKYLGKAITMPEFGAEVASYLLWFVQYQECMKAQWDKDTEYYSEYKKMYSEGAKLLTFFNNANEEQCMMFNFPKTIEWWEENYRAKYNERERKRELERRIKEQEELRRLMEEEEHRDMDSEWRSRKLENRLDLGEELDELAKKMTPGYVLSPDGYADEITEFLKMNLNSVIVDSHHKHLADDLEHINWNANDSLRTAHQYATEPFNRAETCAEFNLFEVSKDDIDENNDINKKELALYYDTEKTNRILNVLNPEGFEYDYHSMYYNNTPISEKDLSEFDAIIQEIETFNKREYKVTLLKDINKEDIPVGAIYVETVPYKVSDIILDGLIPVKRKDYYNMYHNADTQDRDTNTNTNTNNINNPQIEKSASGILYGKEVSEADKYLLNTSIYKELLRIANTFALNLDSIADIYYNKETNKMYIKLPKKFVSKHIYTLYNKKFKVISKTDYINNTTIDKYNNNVYRCNVYNPYKPRNSSITINELMDAYSCDRDDGYG